MGVKLKFHLPDPDQLTLMQKNLIRIDLNDPNRKGRGEHLVVKGYGGTGKTVVAYYRALRYNRTGELCLFLCFNKLLNAHLQSEVDYPLSSNIHLDYLQEFYDKIRNTLLNKVDHGEVVFDNGKFSYQTFDNGGKLFKSLIYQKENGESICEKISSTNEGGMFGNNQRYFANGQSFEFLEILFDWYLENQHKDKLYKEIIVDEGQDLSKDWLKILLKIGEHISIFADDNQQINGGSTIIDMKNIFLPNGDIQELTEGQRTTKEIFEYAVETFIPEEDEKVHALEIAKTCRSIPDSTPNENSRKWGNEDSWQNLILEFIRENSKEFEDILVVCPWKKHINFLSKFLKEHYREPAIYHSGVKGTELTGGWMIDGKNPNVKITTYKSAKGLEGQCVIVFIPRREYDDFVNGHSGELGDHTFYTLATRARERIFFVTDFPLSI